MPNHPSSTNPFLLGKFEQLSFLIHRLSEQFCTAITLLQNTTHKKEIRTLLYNLQTLNSQFSTVLTLGQVYGTLHSKFYEVSSYLHTHHITRLYDNCKFYCSQLWKFLTYPQLPSTRKAIITFISYLDMYKIQYVLPSHPAEECKYFSLFSSPRTTAQPLVIQQVSTTEITVDPYLKSLLSNYYYPLSPTDIMTIDNNSIINNPSSAPSHGTPLSHKQQQQVTVEASIDVISDLISEIQATDEAMMETEANPT
jgi:hypothetical protein